MALLVVEDLVKTYPGGRKTAPVEAVRGVSFEVQEGEFFGLLGPNGAGKSTTLGCIATLVRPTSGRILVDGIDVGRDPVAARRRIAVVPQVRNLDRDLTVREVLTYHGRYFGLPAAERNARADRLLDQMQVADKQGAKPLTLSGGQQQRVMIARALMHDPRIVLLDEPTTGLDPQGRRMLWETLRKLHASGITFILTTHYMEEAERLCQRLAIVDHGRILTLDTPAALRSSLGTGQILEITLGAEGPLAAAFETVSGVSRVERMDSSGDVERLRLFVDSSAGLIDRVLDAARARGADIHHVSLQAPSLEDVYVHLTGRELRE